MMTLRVAVPLSREEEVKQAVRDKFVQGLEDCEEVILPYAISLALPHKRTGRYLESLGFIVEPRFMRASLFAGGRGKNGAFYAHMVEFGTHKMAPQAILRRAEEAAKDTMGQVIAKRMREVR